LINLNQFANSLKSFNWRSLQKYTSPKAVEDMNVFLEKLPQHAGQTLLIMAAVAWAAAGASGLYVTIQMRELTKLRTDLQEAKAVKPMVPVIKEAPVPPQEITDFVDKMGEVYNGVSIKENGSSILITSAETIAFGQFREAIGHVQNGGSGWRVNIERLCVGRECDKQPLAAAFNLTKVSVDKPE
jgi:hypothetical protein